MKKFLIITAALLWAVQIFAQEEKQPTAFVMETPWGVIEGILYDDTPLHRDNFIKLINEGWYEETDINTIIPGLYIQGGSDKDGNMDPGYTIPGEIKPEHIHKRGALAAASPSRFGNFDGSSSGAQFFIVQGMDIEEEFLNKVEVQRAESELYRRELTTRLFAQSDDPELKKALDEAFETGNRTTLTSLMTPFEEEARRLIEVEKIYKFSDYQRSTYLSEGGAPELDGSYTVFGEITKGMDVVDKISRVKIVSPNKPKDPLKIKIMIKEEEKE